MKLKFRQNLQNPKSRYSLFKRFVHADFMLTPVRFWSRTSNVSPPSPSSRSTLLIKLSCEASQEVQYLPGDHLGIFPSNQKYQVDGLLARVVDAPSSSAPIVRLERRCDRKSGGLSAGQQGEISDTGVICK